MQIPTFNLEIPKYIGIFCLAILIPAQPVWAILDFLTDNPQLIITIDESRLEKSDGKIREIVVHAANLIREYYNDWQGKYGRLRRHLKINLIPIERQISIQGIPAEGVWSWSFYDNEKGTAVLGVNGNLYVNINSTLISQEALIAHESSHAFLLTYQPKLLDSWSDFTFYNEGLAETFAVEYEPKPWRGWRKMISAHRFKENFDEDTLSLYGLRILYVLNNKPVIPHNVGFFFLYVVRNGKVDLDKDLKECTNNFILSEVREWLKNNPDQFDIPGIRE